MPKLAITTSNGILFIEEMEIIYCQAQGSYTYLFLDNPKHKKLTVSKSLNKVLATLNNDQFIRTHQSYAVNLEHVVRYDGAPKNTVTMSNGVAIPVSRSRKDDFFDGFNKL